jgi:hypothetical protein
VIPKKSLEFRFSQLIRQNNSKFFHLIIQKWTIAHIGTLIFAKSQIGNELLQIFGFGNDSILPSTCNIAVSSPDCNFSANQLNAPHTSHSHCSWTGSSSSVCHSADKECCEL